MTVAEFKKKWARYQGKESAAYQEHFNDLCHILGQPTPVEADPSGNDSFCFQKRVVKDAELFDLEHPDSSDPTERGFADVWRKDCFGWEYKGKKKNLGDAYKQLLRYREALLNPPLLIVCDFDRYIIRTNFNGTVQETQEFTNDQIDRPENWRTLRALFENPNLLKPQRTTAQVTTALAEEFAKVARSLQKRESAELADAHTRAEVNVAQRRSLRIARFLNRLIFCFFAEDTGLLPKNLFSELARTALDDSHQLSQALESLFRTMATGGMFGAHKIRHFNGHLFEDATVFDLNAEERRSLAEASEADWQYVEPSIMGTLFARGLDPDQSAALGAQYTSRTDIVTIVEPVLMAPLRREWAELKASLLPAFKLGKGRPGDRARLEALLKKLRKIVVMDPACGSANFLYVALQMLLDLEKEVITFATMLGFHFTPEVGVHQLRAFEINPYAYELAQVTVQIGYLQWRRDNGFDNNRTPVLQNLDGFQNEDALLVPHFHNKARTLKQAQADEHKADSSLKFYTEREWPQCDVLVGNPPFLGGSKLWKELGRAYQQELWRVYEGRVPGFADLCCYWFEKARQQVEAGKCERAGLLATQAIRGGASREVLKRIKETGNIFFAESDRDWVLAGANVHVSMIGFDDGTEKERHLDGKRVAVIHANLTAHADVTGAKLLRRNQELAFSGTKKSGDFDIPDEAAREWLLSPNPHGRPNSDLLRPWLNGSAIVKRMPPIWIIDTGTNLGLGVFALYEKPYAHALNFVKPQRDENKREHRRLNWWLHAETCPGMRTALRAHLRFLTTPRVSKFRIFSWADSIVLPDDGIYIFARSDDFFFGIVQGRFHEVWARSQGTQVRERESGFRYTPTTCFENFPFPFPGDLQPLEPLPVKPPPKAKEPPEPDRSYAENLAAKNYFMGKEEPPPYGSRSQHEEAQPSPSAPLAPQSALEHRAAVAAAAKELNDLRERWLNPPEWTVERILEFPGSADGPWSRYVADPDKNGIGTVGYPRLEPRDADCAAKLKQRTLTNLYNERPAWLDLEHKKLEVAVAAAYGWPADLTDEQILEKLLALNLERAAEEAKAAKEKKLRASREKQGDEMI
jgi:type II restriction/modification system DNA methylase subunit YeeA